MSRHVTEAPARARSTEHQEVAAVSPAAAPPPAQPGSTAAGGYGVRSHRFLHEEEAKKILRQPFEEVCRCAWRPRYEIRKAEIAGKGTFYRVPHPCGLQGRSRRYLRKVPPRAAAA